MSAAIELRDLRLTLGRRTILSAVSLAVEAGEFVGVLGPNGAGKTTLMRAILGLLRPAAGEIRLFGEPVAGRGRHDIGYMPQARSFPANVRLSAADFVASALDGERWGLPLSTAARRAEVERVFAAVGVPELAPRPIAELSGGQRQRLLIAQALLGQPRILLLDEPLISLDPQGQHAMVAMVGRLRDKLGLTVLFSAHEVNPLLGVMDRVLYLGGGGAAIGTVDEVIQPAVLSLLYGTPIEVLRLPGRIFVTAGGVDVEGDSHGHHHEHGHGHGHGHDHGHDHHGHGRRHA